MSRFGMFQIIGAAITTIGLMFLIITCMSYTGILPTAKIGVETGIISLLMTTNGFLILLFGIMTTSQAAGKSAPAATTVN
jgi:hypothetical protein